MMKKIINLKLLTLLCAMFICGGAFAQGIKDIRINEVLVKNNNSLVDGYGENSSWIELHNTGYSVVNIAGAQLSVTAGGKTTNYKIPKGDPSTSLAPQAYVVFYATGKQEQGIYYTNFTLENVSEIKLLDASRTGVPVDSMQISYTSQKEDVAYGWFTPGGADKADLRVLNEATPGSTNDTDVTVSRADNFREKDPNGFAMAITAMSVVFMALCLLFFVFKSTGKAMVAFTKSREKKSKEALAKANNTTVEHTPAYKDGVPGAVIAAITLAIQKYEEDVHDMESTVITINKVARAYSPWSSKIYGTSNQPNRR
ncbi:MAG: OadG family transporter subunit [Rikenellaceae bacterium]